MTEETIFTAALERADPSERAAFLADACGTDAALRGRIELLLAAHSGAGDFLNRPAVALAESGHEATRAFGEAADRHPADTRTQDGNYGPPPDDESLSFLAPPRRPDSLGRIGHY